MHWQFHPNGCALVGRNEAFTGKACRTVHSGISEGLLIVRGNDESTGFSQLATGDKFWLSYRYESTQCYAKSGGKVPSKTTTTNARKSNDDSFFTGAKLLVLDVLLREEKSNHDHFLAVIAP
jgi:hypothetical protein